jgi:hypothetical protein
MTKFIKGFKNDYRFLSNFTYTTVEYEGTKYPTIEHAFQAAKFDDLDYREVIADAETPGDAKVLGKTREHPLREGWNEGLAVQVMAGLVAQKFSKGGYRDRLLATGDAILVETNHWGDDIWGDSTTTDEPGRNQLGIILMSVRAGLQAATR